jgi:peptidoglycan/xylan/chitin deacetylase (PgdA/CDA1 family)
MRRATCHHRPVLASHRGLEPVPSWLVPPLRGLRARRSLLLAYHGVALSDPGQDPHNLRVPPSRFRAHIELLLRAGFEMVTVAGLAERAAGGRPPPGLAALSFDDGMDDNHSVLLPILEEYRIPATVYVTTGLIGQSNPWLAPESGARMMTEHELRDLAAAGIELGAHTVTHPDLSLLGYDECLREPAGARADRRDAGEDLRVPVLPLQRDRHPGGGRCRIPGRRDVRGAWWPLPL